MIDTGPSTFTAPPRTTTLARGNYGNGWRDFYAAEAGKVDPLIRDKARLSWRRSAAKSASRGTVDPVRAGLECAGFKSPGRETSTVWTHRDYRATSRINARPAAPNYRGSRRACRGPGLVSAGRFSLSVHSSAFSCPPVGISVTTESPT